MDVNPVDYGGLFVVFMLCVVHYFLYRAVKRVLASWFDDKELSRVFMSIPLPWLMHLAVLHFSFLFTVLLVWLIHVAFS